MSLHPHQVRDLIISTSEKIKKLQEARRKAVTTIKKKFKEARSDESVSDDEMNKKERFAIEEQDRIFDKALEDLKEVLDNLIVQRNQMLKDLELPTNIEELIKFI